VVGVIEAQTYTNSSDNVIVAGGNLKIAKKVVLVILRLD
jgi:hypothetical protein